MKKIFTLLSVIALGTFANAQTTTVLSEDFAAYTAGGNTTSTGSTAPDGTDIYNPGSNTLPSGVPSANFTAGTKVYQAGGMAKLGTGSLIGSMSTKVLDLSTDGGKVSVAFDVKGWSSVEGPVVVSVSSPDATTNPYFTTEVTYSALLAANTLDSKTVSFAGGLANSTITFSTKVKRAFLDNIVIKTDANLSLNVNDINKLKNNFVRNTKVNNEISFGEKANVKIYNVSGSLVKSASVEKNTSLNVSSLPKGVYVVTGEVNGQSVSQKIVKE